MAKNSNPPAQSPAPAPGAVPPAPLPDPEAEARSFAESTEGDPEALEAMRQADSPAEDPTLEVQPTQQAAEGKAKFRVNWVFSGFREDDLAEGDVVEATEAEAAPFLGGVLTRIEPEA